MKYWMIALLLVPWQLFAAEDQIVLDATVISGNQELPRVLFIQPWQETISEVPQVAPRLDADHFLSPICPHTYRRLLQLDRQRHFVSPKES